MHRHDLELIAALADGTLEDETLARERVDSCDECQTEFEAQTSAIVALATLTPATMTEHEKAALHRDLWTELRTGAAPKSTPAVPWWYRWSYAAGALFVVVGLVAVLSQVNGGDDDGGTELASTDVSAASAEEASEPPADAGPIGGGEQDSAGGDQALNELAAETAGLTDLAQQLKSLRHTGRALSVQEESQYDDCLREAGLDDHQVIETHTVDDSEYLTVIPVDAPDDESEDVTHVDATTCEIVSQDE